jgi:hypothetical protein
MKKQKLISTLTDIINNFSFDDKGFIEDAIEDGIYHGANFSLSLVWSYADNIQF